MPSNKVFVHDETSNETIIAETSNNNTNSNKITEDTIHNSTVNKKDFTQEDCQKEEDRIAKVKALIQIELNKLNTQSDGLKKEIVEQRKQMWKDASNLILDFDDVIEYNQFGMEMKTAEAKFGGMVARIPVLNKMLDHPYFGRLDFTEETEDGVEPLEEVYVGMSSIHEEGSYRFYVYDWRAPISSMFYDCEEGRGSYHCLDGEIQGQITLKRQYKFNRGQLEYMFDSSVKIDDEILQKVLASASEGKIKSIVSSIQREQNTAIRVSNRKDLIILGPAGSGKTSVGLHRVAYLLYTYRNTLLSRDVVVFTHNNIFSTYIANIIPELGEDDIVRVSLSDLLKKRLSDFHDQYEQAEYLLGQGADVRRKGIEIKNSQEYLAFIEQYLQKRKGKFTDIEYHGELICKAAVLAERNERDKSFSLKVQVDRLYTYADYEMDQFFKQHEKEIKKRLDAEAEEFIDLHEAFKTEVQKFKSRVYNDLRFALGFNANYLYIKSLAAFLKQKNLDKGIISQTKEAMANKLYYEDAVALFAIKLLCGEIKSNTAVKHVVIDEAQDYSPMQHFIINRLFRSSRFTLLADVNQALFSPVNTQNKEALIAAYAFREPAVMELGTSYRSTQQINAFAQQFLQTPNVQYFNRQGPEPELLQSPKPYEAMATLLKDLGPDETAAILTRTQEEASRIYQKLKTEIPIRLLKDKEDAFERGTFVMPVYLAKGLEFDTVLLYGLGDIGMNPEKLKELSEEDKRIYYLMVTRALHRLVLL